MREAARAVIHLDMDAFFASVEMLDNPALRGRPVIVGGAGNRGVVSAASYEARNFGVHSAMPVAAAARRCPAGVFLPVRMARYKEISNRIFAVFDRFTPLVEPLSIDEAFLDVTGSTGLFGNAEEIAGRIRAMITEEIGLTVSAGVASNKLIAKIASDFDKPDGLTVVPAGKEKEFLAPLPIAKLWGVGKATRQALVMLSVRTIGDLRRLPLELLERKFGKHGRHLFYAARGEDDRPVEPGRQMKSVAHEETFADDLVNPAVIRKELLALANKTAARLRRYGVAGRTITLKIKYHDFVQRTRSKTMAAATDDSREIYRIAIKLLEKTEAGVKPLRLLGVSLSLLQHPTQRQGGLFQDETVFLRQQRLNRAVDTINGRYGAIAILPGALLKKKRS